MTEVQWVLVFAALFLVLVVLALMAYARRSSERGRVNPYASGDDPSPHDSEFGRDSDTDLDRRRDADFDDGT
jgi:NADH:ubiquinone oxidoreductase subunit 3 (subunit A)